MDDPHCGIGPVHILSARSGRTESGDLQFFRTDLDRIQFFRLRQNGDRNRARMDPAAGFRGRYALNTVDTAFKLHPGKNIPTGEGKSDILHTPESGFGKVQHFCFPAPFFGVMQIHPEHFRCKKSRFIAARRRFDLHNGVAGVVGIRRDQRDHDLFFRFCRFFFQTGEFTFRQFPECRIFFRFQKRTAFLCLFQHLLPGMIERKKILQPAPFAHECAGLCRVGIDCRIAQRVFQFGKTRFHGGDQIFQLGRCHCH